MNKTFNHSLKMNYVVFVNLRKTKRCAYVAQMGQ